jgi:Ca2+-binding RTX toxin-like protein
VSRAAGTVTVQHADGSTETLAAGMSVYQGDLLITDADGAVGVRFIDDTQFSLGARGRMVLDEMIFDADSGDGSARFSLIGGTFSFVSGQIAKAGTEAMQVKTPVATIGIRGTSGSIGIGGTDADLKVVLIPDADGAVGEIQVTMADGQTFSLNLPMGALAVANGRPTSYTMTLSEFDRDFGGVLRGLDSYDDLRDRINGLPDTTPQNTPDPNDAPGDETDGRRSETDDAPGADGEDDGDVAVTGPGPGPGAPEGDDRSWTEGSAAPIKVVLTDHDYEPLGTRANPILGGGASGLKTRPQEDSERSATSPGGTAGGESSSGAQTAAAGSQQESAKEAPGKTGENDEDDNTDTDVNDTNVNDTGNGDDGAADGDGPGGDGGTGAATTQSGAVIDHYVSGATVWVDYDGDGVRDADEPSTTTGGDGHFSLTATRSGQIVSQGGVDTITGATIGTLKAPVGSSVVTPVTTLMQELILSGKATSVAGAQSQVATALGIGLGGVDVTRLDPIGGLGSSDAATAARAASLTAAGVILQSVAALVAATLAGAGASEAAASAAAFRAITNSLGGHTSRAFLSNASALESIIDSAAKDAAVAASVDGAKVASSKAAAASTIGALTAQLELAAADASDPSSFLFKIGCAALVAQTEAASSLKAYAATGQGDPAGDFSGANLQARLEAAESEVGDPDGPTYGTAAGDTLSGGSGTDEIHGRGGNDTLNGLAGGDKLYGDDGDDVLNGGDGGDKLYGGAGNDSLNGGNGNDSLAGDAGDDILRGGAGADTLTGGAGTDTLFGDAGDDSLVYDEADILDGGDGIDTVTITTATAASLAKATNIEVIDMTGGVATVLTLTAVESLLGAGQKTLTVRGGNGDGVVLGDPTAWSQGEDIVDGTTVYQVYSTLDGYRLRIQSGITVTDADLTLTGGGGADILDGGGGRDTLYGGQGNDTLHGGSGDDTLYGEAGNDTLYGDGGADRLFGGDGNDTLEGSLGSDTLDGGGGDDLLIYDGADSLDGGGGTDTVRLTTLGATDLAKATNVEIIDMSGGLGTVLTLSAASVAAIVGAAGDAGLWVRGDTADSVVLDDDTAWSRLDDVTENGDTYHVYRHDSGSEVRVEAGVSVDNGATPPVFSTADDFGLTRGFWTPLEGVLDVTQNGPESGPYTLALAMDTAGALVHLTTAGLPGLTLVDGVNDAGTVSVTGSLDDIRALIAQPNGILVKGGLADSQGGGQMLAFAFAGDGGTGDPTLTVTLTTPSGLSQASTHVLPLIDNSTAALANSAYSGLIRADFATIGGEPVDWMDQSVHVGDVNGDGFDDVLFSYYESPYGTNGYAQVLLGGAGGQGAAVLLDSVVVPTGGQSPYAAGPVLGVGDINGDGIDDLVLGSPSDQSTTAVMWGGGAPLSGDSPTASATIDATADGRASSAVLGDFNGDGAADVAKLRTTDSGGAVVQVAWGDGDGTPGPTLATTDLASTDPRAAQGPLTVGDFNGDGFDDLAVASFDDYAVTLHYGGADGTFGDTATVSWDLLRGELGFNLQDLHAGDVNGDGLDDLIFHMTDGADGERLFIVEGGTAVSDVLEAQTSIQANGHLGDVAVGDWTGDGLDDIAFTDDGGTVSIVFGQRGDGFGHQAMDDLYAQGKGLQIDAGHTGAQKWSVIFGDVNGDGFDDLIVGASPGTDADIVFGRDALGVVTRQGTSSDDSLTGSGGADLIVGGAGNDILTGGGGADILRGGRGDDVLTVADNTFALADGGDGDDVLVLAGGFSGTLRGASLRGIETVALGAGTEAVTLTLGAGSTHGRLVISGDSADGVLLASSTAWTQGCDVTVDGTVYATFTNSDGGSYLIQAGIGITAEPTLVTADSGAGVFTDVWTPLGRIAAIGHVFEETGPYTLTLTYTDVALRVTLDADDALTVSDDPATGTLDISGSLADLNALLSRPNALLVKATEAGGSPGIEASVAAPSIAASTTAAVSLAVIGTLSEAVADGADGTAFTDTSTTTPWSAHGDETLWVGDLNGDGFADAVFSHTYDDTPQSPAWTALVVFGAEAGKTPATAHLEAPMTVDGLHQAQVVALADLDGDGLDDILWSQPYGIAVTFADRDGDGAADWAVGSTETVPLHAYAYSTSSPSIFGTPLGHVGDVTGDGVEDVTYRFANSTEEAWGITLVAGATSQPSPQPYDIAASLQAVAEEVSVQADLVAVGDFDGDGVDEVVYVETPDSVSFQGRIHDVPDDADQSLSWTGADQGHLTTLQTADVNGDGFDDIIGWAQHDDDGGIPKVHILYGGAGGPETDFASESATVLDLGTDTLLGKTLGDFNGDGAADLAWLATNGSETALNVIFGSRDGIGSASFATLMAAGDGTTLSLSVAGSDGVTGKLAAGDVNGDGFDDLLLGTGRDGHYGMDVVHGRDFQGIVTCQGTAGDDSLTGSGGADLIVGGAGNDILTGGGGADILRGGAGNDLLIATDSGFQRVDGGDGVDVLRLMEDVTLPTTGETITDVESIELGTASENVTVTIGGLSYDCVIDGDAGDTVAFEAVDSAQWTAGISADGYTVFTHPSADGRVLVSDEIGQVTGAYISGGWS